MPTMSFNDNYLYEFDRFAIDLNERTLWRDGEVVPLPPKVMETLCLLVQNPGRLMTKAEMMDQLWADTFVEERNLTQNVFTLRKVLGDGDEGKKFVETVPRRGYRFVAEVRPVEFLEALQVTHNKKTRISAEGNVSAEELTEAAKHIARSMELDSEPHDGIGHRQTLPAKTLYRRSVVFAVIGLVVVFASGSVFWGWQNDRFGFRKAAFASVAERGLLEFDRLTDSGKVFFPIVSPNNQFFAYVSVDRGKFGIELQSIATGSKTVVVNPTDREIGRPRFSSDGNYIHYRLTEYLGGPGVAYRVPIFGGSPRRIAGGILSELAISPDGEWLAFVRSQPEIQGQQLVICRSSDGSEERVIATRTGNESFIIWGFAPEWSPDGKSVFAGLIAEPTAEKPDARGEGFGLMNIADGSFERVNTPEWNNFIQAVWTPDANSILFLARSKPHEPFQIWQVDYPSGEGRRITNDSHDYRHINIATDGEFILTTQEKTFFNLWTIPTADATQAKQLTFSSELKHGDRGISWTPDGKHLVYTLAESNIEGKIWKINVETLETQQLIFDEHQINWHPRVMPDGSSVIFTSTRQNGTHVWQMDLDGANLRQITDGASEGFSNISSNGKWLIYASPAWNPDALWKTSLPESEPPVKLLSDVGGSNSISPDSRHLVVSYKTVGEDGRLEYKYGLMGFEPTDRPQDLGFNPYLGAMAWLPDSGGFFYITDQGLNQNNIWFYDMRTRAHRQITNLNDRMSGLSLSPDGNILATARGATVSNIFKISGF